MNLPDPDQDAREHSARVSEHIRQHIREAGGWIPFSRYMELALYAPGLGYYTSDSRKFGAAGDFITAPELSPLFARALARQLAELMKASGPVLLEVGAGTGALAAELLSALEHLGCLPSRYDILDLSGELRERQQQTLVARVPHLAERVRWLDSLPASFEGVVVANELLDAMPAECVAWSDAGIAQRGVALAGEAFIWQDRQAGGALLAAAQALPVGAPYVSEINLAAAAWVRAVGQLITRGAMVLIDYGFPAAEFYHPQRASGTLMCHYRHHAHADPFAWPGLTDITTHIDFSAIAHAGVDAGCELLGYAAQANFLLDCGLLQELEAAAPADSLAYARLAQSAQMLLSPAEMGELFKVMILGRDLAAPLMGFASGDRSHRL